MKIIRSVFGITDMRKRSFTGWVSSLLTEHLGISFVRLRNEFRLERVEELLRATELPVQTIAEQNGFFNQSHFYRLYKEYFGRLPRQETGAASVT